MQGRTARIALLVAAVAVAAALFAFLQSEGDSGDSDDTAGTGQSGPVASTGTEPEIETIEISGGEVVGGVQTLEYLKGKRIRLRVRSDVAEEVHVHGYDLVEEVKPRGTVSFDFVADIDGIFEVELERSATPIAELEIRPG